MAVYRVTLQPNVLETIEEEIFNTAADSPDEVVECGGWLWSPQDAGWWGSGGIDVQEAAGSGPDTEKRYDGMTFQSGYMHDLDEMFRRDGLELCGGFHLHHSGDPQPSSVDLDPTGRIAYVLDHRARLKCRTQRALEIVVCRSPGSASWDWTPHPYVFYRGAGPTSLRTEGIWPEGAYLVQ